MAVLRTLAALVMIAAVGLSLGACTRKITRVEQVAAGPQACFECHSDTSTFLLAASEEWQNSKHASGSTLNENDGECKGCHTSEGFVARATGATIPDVVENPTAIGCFTCHAPHSNGDFRLRWTTPATLLNGTVYDLHGANICTACHHSRRNVTTYVTARTTLSSRWGPHHSDQADMLIGSNGYQYPWFTYEQTGHRSAALPNEPADGCLNCHMKTAVGIVLGGHSFNMAFVEGGEEMDNTDACAKCHPGADSFDIDRVQTEVDSLVNDLEPRLVAAGLMSNGSPRSVTTSADSAGAVWNLLCAKEDRSHGVHNPAYIRGLLSSSIQFIRGLGGPTAVRARDAMSSRR